MDGAEVFSTTEPPYQLTYEMPNDGKEHTLNVHITSVAHVHNEYSTSGHSTAISSSTSISQVFVQTIHPLTPNTIFISSDIKGETIFHIGELLECYNKVLKGSEVENVQLGVRIYIDDILMDSSDTLPFNYCKSLTQEDIGSHIIKCEWFYINSNILFRTVELEILVIE